MVYLVEADNLSEAYIKLLDLVMHKGENEFDSRCDYVKECLNVVTTIHDPFELSCNNFNIPQLTLPDGLPWNYEMLEIYQNQFISPENSGFVYSYGERLRNHCGHDQILELVDDLNNDQSSRRAIAVTWNTDLDAERDEVPCLQNVQFNIRHRMLHCTALWRSHDICGAWLINLIGLRHLMEFVHSKLTDKTIKLGTITVHSVSAHINCNDFDLAEHLINRNMELIR